MRVSFVSTGGQVRSTKSKGYAAWKKAAALEIAAQRIGRVPGPYRLTIHAQRHWRSKRARDIDNIIKPVSDALVAAGAVTDDSLCERVSAEWADDLGGPAVCIELEVA